MPSSIAIQYADRSVAIIILGVLAFLFLGPLAGVPAWIMANQDLRDIRAGFLSQSAQTPVTIGKWLAILGTFFSPIWFWTGVVVASVVFGVVGGDILGMLCDCCG